LILEMTRNDTWRAALDRRGWSDAVLAGEEFDAFMDSEQERIAQILDQMGLR
jgi:putative tricarboxylic transport membrane protein